jgi:DNA-directed RNA polymerase specialized sigma24 family protein
MKYERFEGITRKEIEDAIEQYVVLCMNAERNRAVLKRRLIDGLTHEQLAEEFDLSTQAVRKILYRYEAVIFKHLSYK